MATYVTQPNKAERISQALSSLATIAKQVISLKKLEKMDKEEKAMKTAEMISKALGPNAGIQAVPMEVGGQQLAPNIPSGQPDLGFGAGIGSPALPEDVLSQVDITPQGEITRTPIQPPPLPEGFTFTQVPRVPTELESLPGKLALEAKYRAIKSPEEIENIKAETELTQERIKSSEAVRKFMEKYGRKPGTTIPSTKGALTQNQLAQLKRQAHDDTVEFLRTTDPTYSQKERFSNNFRNAIPASVLNPLVEKRYQEYLKLAQGESVTEAPTDLNDIDSLSKEDAQELLDWINSLQLQAQ